ncbi:helix-turn-helix domain-containing protein [Levilactobacillus brevis]|uniref:Helix-turn-helix domain-containing protein n=1 Tax=Levilactobacillus hammesii TaxID=267633 RepID=A0A921F0W5_9LACO|nr:helix-turn-helix domain-containing protein [Levilactobacillus brevis]HJE87103.1 helix-turn-helix domain-containing protein [Levilactobacillus hammesii]
MNLVDGSRYFSMKQACTYLGIKSTRTLNKYISNGLPVISIAGSKRIDKLDADKFMAAHKH